MEMSIFLCCSNHESVPCLTKCLSYQVIPSYTSGVSWVVVVHSVESLSILHPISLKDLPVQGDLTCDSNDNRF